MLQWTSLPLLLVMFSRTKQQFAGKLTSYQIKIVIVVVIPSLHGLAAVSAHENKTPVSESLV